MSPEKAKNQFAILFQQYQTKQPNDQPSLTESDLPAEIPAPAEPPPKRHNPKITAQPQKYSEGLAENPLSETSVVEDEDIKVELLDEEIDSNNLDVIRATRTLPPRRPRKQEKPKNPKLEKLLDEEAQKEAAEKLGPRKRGRPATGKRSDPSWAARTFYVRKTTDEKVEKVLEQMKRYNINLDKSELIDLLLEAWAMVESGEIDDFQIGEILQVDPPKLK
jgi:hypothetical protein